jgi:hypothetical protein
MKYFILILFFTFSVFADTNETFAILTPTTNQAFNYFFSIPIWFAIMSIPAFLIFQLINRFFK